MSCACNVILYSVVLYWVTVVHKFNCVFVLNWTPYKWKTDKTIPSRAKEPANCVNCVCEQDAMEKIVILLICYEEKAKYWGVSVTVKKKTSERRVRETRKEAPCTSQCRKGLETPNETLPLTIFICVCGRQNSTDFYAGNKIVPTCKKLIPITCEKIQSPWG